MIGCRPTWHEQDTMQGCKSARSVLQSRDCHLQQVLGPNLSSQHMGSHVNDDQSIPRLLNMPPCMFTHAQISQHLWTPCGIPMSLIINLSPACSMCRHTCLDQSACGIPMLPTIMSLSPNCSKSLRTSLQRHALQ